MRRMTYEEALSRVAERTADNTHSIRKSRFQRRTEFTDLYGIPFTGFGDANTPASFYVSISPDMIYELRLQFKLHIQPFITKVKGATGSSTVDVNSKSLSISGGSISPNPHDHTTDAHSHNIINGVTVEHSQADNFEIHFAGVDITDYLVEQHEGDWIDGEGIYPNDELEDKEDFYDLLDVATVLYNEGHKDKSDKILNPGFKLVEISADAPFGVTMYWYPKYSNMGR